MKIIFEYKILICFLIASSLLSCDDFVKIDPPRTDLIRSTVFDSDATAEAAVLDIYYTLKTTGFASGTSSSISLLGSLTSDESLFVGRNAVQEFKQFNDNSIQSNNSLLAKLWSDLYATIYKSNAVIEGLEMQNGVSESMKNQLVGEVKFMRAFCHFYAVNLWGDVPLILTTAYELNSKTFRTPQEQVYQQILADLQEAKELLSDEYTISNNERVRVNKGAATAFLSRAYLYLEEWERAEEEATTVIDNVSQYSLEPDLSLVFRGTGSEPILQLWSDQFPNDRNTFYIYSGGPNFGTLRTDLINSFESGDQRSAVWVQKRVVQGVTYYGSRKYFDFSTPPLDYSTILRLSEQYLIRAEARAKQDELAEAMVDVNVIRERAGLPELNLSSQSDILDAISRERRFEFFTEWGHRWFDLKRTGKANEVLSPIKPDWNSEDLLFPIPEIQIINNPEITQNPG
jgi:starch-binding outer membrane protein, SusD/RagB family